MEEPAIIDAADLALSSGTLSSSGLSLDAASAPRTAMFIDERMVCIYLRHISQRQMSLAEA